MIFRQHRLSTSHRSYDARRGNLIALRKFYAASSFYNPNEAEINLAAFDALIAECQAADDAVNAALVEALEAWNDRDAKLYEKPDSILAVFRRAKDYYKSLYDPKTPQYKAITAKDMRLFDNSRD